MKTKLQYVLITGATSGIGYELAKVFAKNHFNLILVARDQKELTRVAKEISATYKVDAFPMQKDLFHPDAPFEIYNDIKAMNLPVYILVNDAGQGVYGKFVEEDIERQLQIIQLNISSLTTLTYLFLKDMIAQGGGKILQLASIVSEIPAPLQAVYGGTKAYVLSFTEALINELKDSGITVTALQESKLADPANVARDGYDALMRGDNKIVSGFKNKIQSVISKITPDTKLTGQMHKQSEKSRYVSLILH